MNKFRLILVAILVAFLILISVFFYGRYLGGQEAKLQAQPLAVSSQLILDRITSQYFLVTKTVFMDSQAEIDTPKRADWTDLFVGKKITVRGLIRVDVGVDLKNLAVKDIVVDSAKKTVTISLPPAAILDSSLFGELDLVEDKAILDKIKGFFKNTQNEDYNLALSTLLKKATEQVSSDGRIFNEARGDSIKLVELIATGLAQDYRVIVE